MKICVATDKGGLEDTVSAVFGRCPTYTFVEVEGKEIKDTEIVQNQFAGAAGGAGIQASQFVAGKGANVVIAGNYGPNAFPILNQAGVKVVSAAGINVKDAVMKYLNGDYRIFHRQQDLLTAECPAAEWVAEAVQAEAVASEKVTAAEEAKEIGKDK